MLGVPTRKTMVQVLAMAMVVFALDRGAKCLVFGRGGASGGRWLGGLVTLRPRRNPRPWGWPGGSRAAWVAAFFVAVVAALVAVELGVVALPAARIGLGAALGGALGNLFDRLRHGAVLDCIGLGRSSSFNPADVALLGGLGSLLVVQAATLVAQLGSSAPVR